MATLNRLDYKTAIPQLEKRLSAVEKNSDDIFIAKVNKTPYRDVFEALKAGKLVFAIVDNSYDTFNVYPYSYAGAGKFFFGRMHGSQNSPAYKLAVLDFDDTWNTYTVNLAIQT